VRVAIVSAHFAEYSIRLAAALAPSVTVRAFVDAGALERESTPQLQRLADAHADVLPLDPRRPWNRFIAVRRLLWRIRAFRPDIIHVQEHPAGTNVKLMELLKPIAPIVLVVHDPEPHSGADTAYFRRRAAFYARGRALADGLIVHGAYCRKLLEDCVEVAGRPVLSTVIGGELRPEETPQTSGEVGRILMFGRMQAYKGVDVLLAAAQRMVADGVDFHLVLAGRGESLTALKPEFEALGRVTIHDRFVSADEIIAELARCSVVALPYLDATQSGVAAAAFANARPVVASRVGGLVDVVRDGTNGLLIPPQDPAALAEALKRMIEEPALAARLCDGARETSRSELSWPAAAAQALPFYRQVIEAAQASGPPPRPSLDISAPQTGTAAPAARAIGRNRR
jgi:glycosyltransferase involved in cell wall biosynthesis